MADTPFIDPANHSISPTVGGHFTLPLGYAMDRRATVLDELSDDVDSDIDQRILTAVIFALENSYPFFNYRAGQVVILLNEEHKAFCDIGVDFTKTLKMPEFGHEISMKSSEPDFRKARAAYGTILFYETEHARSEILTGLTMFGPADQKAIPEYINQWSEQANGMLQYAVWTALNAEGLGVILQHNYHLQEFAAEITKKWAIPRSWDLKAQMVIGKPAAGPQVTKENPVRSEYPLITVTGMDTSKVYITKVKSDQVKRFIFYTQLGRMEREDKLDQEKVTADEQAKAVKESKWDRLKTKIWKRKEKKEEGK